MSLIWLHSYAFSGVAPGVATTALVASLAGGAIVARFIPPPTSPAVDPI